MSVTSTVAKNTIAQIFSKAINIVLGMTLTFLLTHHPAIGRTGFGIYTFALVFTGVFGIAGDWGLNLIAVREGSKNPGQAPEILGNVLSVRFLFSVIACVVSIIVISALPNYSSLIRQVTIIASFTLLFMSLKNSLQIIFVVHQKLHNWAIVEVISNMVALGSIATALIINPSLPAIMTVVVLENMFAAVVAYFFSRKLMTLKLGIFKPMTKFLLWEAFSMGLVGGILTIYNRADIIILSQLKDSGQVADYALAYKLFDVMYIFGAYFSSSLLPVISSLSKDKDKLSKLTSFALTSVILIGLTLMVVTLIIAPIAIFILGGTAFNHSTFILQILSIVLPFALLNQLFQYIILSLGKQKQLLKVAIVALIVNVIFNLLLIPLWGTVSAALSTIFTELLILILGFLILKNIVIFDFSYQTFIKNSYTLFYRMRQMLFRFVPA